MAVVFYVVGTITIVVGLLWDGLVFIAPMDPTSLSEMLSKLAIAAPGLGVMFGGLLMLGAGSVLQKLDKIVRNTNGDSGVAPHWR